MGVPRSAATQQHSITVVNLRLAGPLADVAGEANVRNDLIAAVSSAIDETATTLGVQATLEVSIDLAAEPPTDTAPQLLGITLNGVRCRYPALTPRLARLVQSENRLDDTSFAWTSPWPVDIGAAEDVPSIVRLVSAEALALRPSALLTAEVLDRYMDDVAATVSGVESLRDQRSWVGEVLRTVLDQRISIADHERVGALLCAAEEENATDAAELLVADLARTTIGLRLPDDFGEDLGSGNLGDPDDLLAFVLKSLYEETGLVFPRIDFERPAANQPARSFAARINDLVTAPSWMPPPDLIMVNETPEQICSIVDVRFSAINPATLKPNSMVAASAQEILENAGYTTWTQAQYVTLQLAAWMRRFAGALVTQDQVLGQLESLEPGWPAVVHAARGQLGPALLTQLVRRLANDAVPLRHLPALLERVVDLPAMDLGLGKYAIVTDPVASPQGADQAPLSEFERVESWVRTGLRNYIADAAAPDPGTLVAYLLTPEIESILVQNKRSPADEDRLVSAVDAELAQLPSAARTPAILTSSRARPALRDLLWASHPLVRVLAHDDLPASTVVQPIARIGAGD
ncbi:FHIPEP family type III secretion protein [Kribbella sp. VKM Ac-2569]|uniref:FHIPEP family type III secretion protein n=1 Tax=Kribbella sp. VKM Ac-2569 TaxID=2512220 RepID=UPI001F53E768|nr:FHIPEP family type III secretion protein [Kribbella sp. VKM Ac-2569]